MTNEEVRILYDTLAKVPEDVANGFIELIQGRTADEIKTLTALAKELERVQRAEAVKLQYINNIVTLLLTLDTNALDLIYKIALKIA